MKRVGRRIRLLEVVGACAWVKVVIVWREIELRSCDMGRGRWDVWLGERKGGGGPFGLAIAFDLCPHFIIEIKDMLRGNFLELRHHDVHPVIVLVALLLKDE